MAERIAVVIPLYNQGSLVGRAVRSVLAQTEPVDEIVVVDDGSTDGGGDVVRALGDPRVKVIAQANSGVSAARNRGWKESTCDLVCFLDADDEYLPGFVAEIRALRRQFPDCTLYATSYARQAGERRKEFGAGPEGRHRVDDRAPLLLWSKVCASAACVPKALLEECGGFPEDIALGEDLECWARLLLRGPCAYSTAVSAIYHENPASAMQSRPLQAGEPPIARAYEEHLRKHPGQADRGFEEVIALARLHGFLMGNWLSGRRELVRKAFKGSWRYGHCRKTWLALRLLTLLPRGVGFALYRWIEARKGRVVGKQIREPIRLDPTGQLHER